MASPLKTGKQSVKLGKDGVRVSRIRRDPPPLAKKTVVPDRDELDERNMVIGVLVFAIAIIVVVIGLGSWMGWSPRDYTAHV